MTGQMDLFGGPDVPHQRARSRPRPADLPVINDMEQVIRTIRIARDPGYVLIGAAQLLYRRLDDAGGDVERAPVYEAATVHQLLDQGLLALGGRDHVRVIDGDSGPALLITVPVKTLNQVARWSALRPVEGA